MEILPTGYDSKRFYPRDQKTCRRILNLPEGKRIILSIGSLVKVKGHRNLIHAIGELGKNFKGHIMHNSRRRKSQKRAAGGDNIDAVWKKSIKLVGRKPRDELPLWMNACDIFVLASLNEGNPTVMFEALGCGIPFVSTNVGGVCEIITSK